MVCTMVKKGLIGTALTAGTLYLLFGTAAPSYVKTTFHKVRQSAKASVPFEMDIERARQDVGSLEPAIQKGIEALAKAEIDAEHLGREIASNRDDLNREGKEIFALRTHLRTGDIQLTGGVSYSQAEIKNDLARRMDYYKRLKEIISEKQENLKVRHENVVAARQQLSAMQGAKRDLMVRIEGIETRLNQVKAKRATSEFNFDDSAVGRAKQTVAELETRLEEMARVDELKGKYAERGISVVVDPKRDVVKEIDAEFGAPAKGGSDTASAEKDL